MKHIYLLFLVVLSACILLPSLVIGQGITKKGDIKANIINKTFKETDTILANPGQGWMSQRFPSRIKYLRLSWVDLEPERGIYNWSVIDDAIGKIDKQKGGGIALRIMTCSSHSKGYYCSPKWLFDEGCKGYEYRLNTNDPTSGGADIPRIEPAYDDPIYLIRHAEFIKALGNRYNNNSFVEFLDIGSYGNWGEWHTVHPIAPMKRRQIIDMYVKAFPNKKLVFMTDDFETLSYALEHDVGMRRDGVGSPWHEENWIGSARYKNVPAMADAWKHALVVFEFFGNYNYMTGKGWSFDKTIDFLLNNHVTVINDNIGDVPKDKMYLLDKLAKYAGARIVINKLSHEKTVFKNSTVTINLNLTNTGVGKIYNPYVLRFYLYNSKNEVAFTVDAKSNPNDWLPGNYEIKESFTIPASVKKGTYKLALAIADPKGILPMFRLPINVPTKDGIYFVSELIVK